MNNIIIVRRSVNDNATRRRYGTRMTIDGGGGGGRAHRSLVSHTFGVYIVIRVHTLHNNGAQIIIIIISQNETAYPRVTRITQPANVKRIIMCIHACAPITRLQLSKKRVQRHSTMERVLY